MKKAYAFGAAVFGAAAVMATQFATPKTAQAHNWTGTCTVDMDNQFALTWTYANARNTFTSRTGLTNGSPAVCSTSHTACWMYRHRCSANYVNIDDPAGVHWHLSFTDPGFDAGHHGSTTCGFGDPGDGYGSGMKKRVNNQCIIPDWKVEPRKLNTHNLDQWIKIAMESSSTGGAKVFDLPRIRIGGTEAVEFWYRSITTNQWYYWSNLGPGNWDLSAWVNDVDEVQVTGSGAGPGTIEIADFDLRD